jgi:sugar/nucleoside kinase (ribokinase family)
MVESSSDHVPAVIVLGDVMTDLVVHAHGPIAVGSDTPSSIEVHAGGAGANLAAWLASAGVVVHFVGCVGADAFGALHRAALERAGVTAHLAVDATRPTGTVVALVDDAGERSMLADRGANLGLEPRHVPEDLLRGADCFHLSGYTLLSDETRAVGLAALQLARAAGLCISVDPASAAPLAAVGRERFLTWTRGADLCLPNRDEACILSGETEPEAAAQALCDVYGAVVLKLGAQGALLAARGQPQVRVRGEPVDVRDTTGAGDAFCAGFLASWLRGGSPTAALESGVRLGALAAVRVGARPPGADLPAGG